MFNLSWPLLLLAGVTTLIYLFLIFRVLDRMKLSDGNALLVLAAMLAGSFINIPLSKANPEIALNLGGAVVPLILILYLWFSAGTGKEKWRSLLGAGVTGGLIWFIGNFLLSGRASDPESAAGFWDTLWLYPLLAGIVGYLCGRSRRASFIAAGLGILFYDLGYAFWLWSQKAGSLTFGGAGIYDPMVASAVLAVLLAEIVGEVRERLAGGPQKEDRDPDLLANLRSPSDPQADPQGGGQ